ncbi:MATE efflux family protein [Treponema primitia ZAS-2]|uniref:Multidrug-efflux transporter n=2 Tax=Treponema primitia TaxID=88058 RepID=F5YJF4_TREPZ|nr:MATE efflux family protein [Treponema primitia ZAS-2]
MRNSWNNHALFYLLWPLMVEQILTITVGILDTVMVSVVGQHAVSGVSLVDSITILLIIAFGALSTGGSVVVSQYIGRRDFKKSSLASKQLIYTSVVVAAIITALSLLCYRPMLQIIYGKIEADVMGAAETYFWITLLSYPFLAVNNAAASLFRSVGNSAIPMKISILVNLINFAGNAILIYGFHMGVTGAAIATLTSRAVAAIVLLLLLRSRAPESISISGLSKIRLEFPMIRSILNIGIPSALENSMFQIGKIMVSRIFTFFGTGAIAANAIAGIFSTFMVMPGQAASLAMLTIVGQCVGARAYEDARYFAAKLIKLTYAGHLILCTLCIIFMDPLTGMFGLTAEAQDLAKKYLLVHTIFTPITWPLSFVLPNALRAAGDVRYSMIVAIISMWTIRVSVSYLLSYTLGFGSMGVWYAMVVDWAVRGTFYLIRWKGNKWQNKAVIKS